MFTWDWDFVMFPKYRLVEVACDLYTIERKNSWWSVIKSGCPRWVVHTGTPYYSWAEAIAALRSLKKSPYPQYFYD